MSGWCDRPSCSSVATAAFTFDGVDRVVWLDDVDAHPASAAGHLCTRHADTLRPPRGWTVHERRAPTPPASPEPVTLEPGSRPTAPEPTVPVAAEVPAPAWSPAGPAGADLDAVLDARTPLLSRAFRAVRDT